MEEILYPAMEDFAIDVMIGRGPSARSLRLSLKPFTVVGATTRAGRISSPLRDRFGAVYRLDYYAEAELAEIVRRSAGILGVDIDEAAVAILAARGRGTPRIVNRLLRRTRDHAQVRGDGRITRRRRPRAAMEAMDIDPVGLDTTDRRLLAAIVQKFGSGPVGGAAIAAVIGEEVETVEDVYEPYLLQLGFLDRTPQGRVATELAREHLRALGYEVPPPRRPERDDPGLWDGVTAEGRSGARGRGAIAAPAGPARPVSATRDVGRPSASRSGPRAAARRTRARAGRLETPHGVVETPDLHARRHERHGQGARPRRPRARSGATIILANTYHLSLRPGHERIARARRPPSLHGLGPAHPHRFGRLPGRQPGRPARIDEERRHVPLAPRRRAAALHARSTPSPSRRRSARTSRSASTSPCRRTPRRGAR